ncbi:MAG TPA: phenylalanine--tRNA ligase subunit beta [Casimicrobiaceae bacterium]|nr:phenylalanine--tRNA ligase subunit beta [Casimicrobiaceae bacterium]
MKFSEAWLRSMANPSIDSIALSEALTMAGLEVETREPAGPTLDRVVVGRIVDVKAHPSADRLRVCTVNVGTHGTLSIVCGASNAKAGMTSAVALPGARFANGTSIEESEIRGVRSQGMLCSASELGLGEDASGLLDLDNDIAPGSEVFRALALDDTLLTLKLTPNRADCLSILGVARELSAVTDGELVVPTASVAITSNATHHVRVDEPGACPRFASRLVEGVDAAAPTPAWMAQRLVRSGIRPISPIVDITNYVMLELGQPLHAYDQARLEGDIVVRFPREGETLLLLNGQRLELDLDLLLVCDEKKPLGLAGIMGGEASGITATTRTVLLEGAFWNPAVIQGRMRRLGFVSDAGYRFERGVDFELPPRAVDRATELLLAICGGRAGPLADVKATLPARNPVAVRVARVEKILGVPVTRTEAERVFAMLKLGFSASDETITVTPPSWRYDLAIEEDFIEEIARIRGYDTIPARMGPHRPQLVERSSTHRSLAQSRERLVGRDYQEVITFSFVDGDVEAAIDARGAPLRVMNPIAAQRDVMRTSLLPGLLEVLTTNLQQRADRVRIFEIGRVFHDARADASAQPMRVGGLAFGDAFAEQWAVKPARGVDFFDVKGDVEALVFPVAVATERGAHAALHPGRSGTLRAGERSIGWIGELHPRLVRRFELPRAPVVFELDLEAAMQRDAATVRRLSRQPVVRRDLAVLVDDSLAVASLTSALSQASLPFVQSIAVFDVYRGRGLPPGRKSVAILVLMQDTARTLTDADIDATMAHVVALLDQRFDATLRT